MSDEHVVATRSFFAPRAAGWDARFPDDGPAYRRAVADTVLARGQAVLDLGCGTGRAFAALRAAVGTSGAVVGVDVTPEMLDAAHAAALDADASLVLGDARRLPFRAPRVRCSVRGRTARAPARRHERPLGAGAGRAARRPARALPSHRAAPRSRRAMGARSTTTRSSIHASFRSCCEPRDGPTRASPTTPTATSRSQTARRWRKSSCGRRWPFDRYPVMLTPMVLVSRYCSKPSMPFWRPMPLAL